METLRRLFTLRRLRNIFCIASFVAAGVAALGLIGSPRAITQDGSGPRQDYAGSRVHTSTAGATARPTPLCQGPCSLEIVLSEDFDNVAPPTLPPDWLATNALGPAPLWVIQFWTADATGEYIAQCRVR
jgi:hypothetical protein